MLKHCQTLECLGHVKLDELQMVNGSPGKRHFAKVGLLFFIAYFE